jgi:hypothetical protein
LIPDNPEDFKGNPLFKSLPGHGLAATLGAQPNVGYFPPSLGNLTFRPNYPGDLPGGKVENLPFRRTIETPEGLTDTQFINNLIKAATSYKNNLSYDPLPVPGVEGFNSNSFFAGVLMGATGHFPSLDIGPVYQAPGYYEPIPLDPLSK